jgi:hypothetical protein
MGRESWSAVGFSRHKTRNSIHIAVLLNTKCNITQSNKFSCQTGELYRSFPYILCTETLIKIEEHKR